VSGFEKYIKADAKRDAAICVEPDLAIAALQAENGRLRGRIEYLIKLVRANVCHGAPRVNDGLQETCAWCNGRECAQANAWLEANT
jgi:hypothetical protein